LSVIFVFRIYALFIPFPQFIAICIGILVLHVNFTYDYVNLILLNITHFDSLN